MGLLTDLALLLELQRGCVRGEVVDVDAAEAPTVDTTPPFAVALPSNGALCITNDESFIQNDELFIQNDELCVLNDGFCITSSPMFDLQSHTISQKCLWKLYPGPGRLDFT